MRVLAIDTSSRVLGVAVLDNDGRELEFNYNFELRHASHLIPTIRLLLKFAGLGLKDLDAYCISIGPGSFTGLRIGVSTVKALAIVDKKKVVAVPSLDVVAYNIAYTNDTICVVVDAKKEKLYTRFYKYMLSASPHPRPALDRLWRSWQASPLPQRGEGSLSAEALAKAEGEGVLLIGYQDLLDRIKKLKNDIVLVGDGISKIKNQKSKIKNLKDKIRFAGEEFWHPRAINTARIGFEMLKRGCIVKDIDSLVPVYMHPKDVQCKR